MGYSENYLAEDPTREEMDRSTGMVLLEFGADWCPHCVAIQTSLQALLGSRPEIHHLKIADGKGKRLGRSFRVKLWPNFVFLRDGELVQQLARPSEEELGAAFAALRPQS